MTGLLISTSNFETSSMRQAKKKKDDWCGIAKDGAAHSERRCVDEYGGCSGYKPSGSFSCSGTYFAMDNMSPAISRKSNEFLQIFRYSRMYLVAVSVLLLRLMLPQCRRLLPTPTRWGKASADDVDDTFRNSLCLLQGNHDIHSVISQTRPTL
jgi:hypothetical protein